MDVKLRHKVGLAVGLLGALGACSGGGREGAFTMLRFALQAAAGMATVVSAGILCVLVALRKMERSVTSVEPPTADMLREEQEKSHALFALCPVMRKSIAWRSLGNFPTPVHQASLERSAEEVRDGEKRQSLAFQVKREDLSSPHYGGSKVRTLQHILASVEAKFTRQAGVEGQSSPNSRDDGTLYVVGSGGSNQVVATTLHGNKLLENASVRIVPLWLAADAPDLDNTINMLSVLSLKTPEFATWGQPFQLLSKLVVPLLCGRPGRDFILPPGGNNSLGVLGQVSGALELALQIERGEAKDMDAIYVPVGSSCTISGLIVGCAIAEHLGLGAFRRRNFEIVGVIIHHALAAAQRFTGVHTSSVGAYLPMTCRRSVQEVCRLIKDAGGPDVLKKALRIMHQSVRFETQARVVGFYGAHSELSRKAAKEFDAHGRVETLSGEGADSLWLCGHFCAKAYAVMVADLEKKPDLRALLWQTKSAVQPLGVENDEWERLKSMPQKVRKWADKGKAESTHRDAHVNTVTGSSGDYRHIMHRVE